MVVAAEGGIPYEVGSGRFPSWAPTGLEIAFFSTATGSQEAFWMVSRDTVAGTWGEATQWTDLECYLPNWAPDGSGVLCAQMMLGSRMVLVSREGEVLWSYDLETSGLRWWGAGYPRFSRDGSTIYFSAYHEDGSAGIWAVPLHGGGPSLVVESAELVASDQFSVGPDRLYVTIAEHESDIWVADVEVVR
jgi:Tol biopolymer transport system component